MREDFLLFLSFLYAISALFYIVLTVLGILRAKEIRIIHGVKGMWAFIYGFLPMLIYAKEALGYSPSIRAYYPTQSIFDSYLVWILSILYFFLISIFYKWIYQRSQRISGKQLFVAMQENNQNLHYDGHVFICGFFSLIIGWGTLVLWTQAYGSIHNFIMNAALIRSGMGTESNSLAFMKHFTGLIQISLYALISAYLIRKPKGINYLWYILLILCAAIGTYTYILASDSRTAIALAGIGVVILFIRHRKSSRIYHYILGGSLLALLLLFTTIFADSLTNYARYGVWTSQDITLLDSIIREFEFIPNAQTYVLQTLSNGDLHLKFSDDIINAVTRWIPERFIPFTVPPSVWMENTLNIFGGNFYGAQPTDLFSTSVYYFGYLGFILPILFGMLIGWIDARMKKYQNAYYTDPYYAFLFGLFVHQVSHSQISTFVLASFPLFLYFLISCLFRNINFKKLRA